MKRGHVKKKHAGVSFGFGGGAEPYQRTFLNKRSRTNDQSIVLAAENGIASVSQFSAMEHLLHKLMEHTR